VWIPFVWMFLAGSRYVSSWLELRGPMLTAAAYSEGSPVDRATFLLLIILGLFVLSKRKIDYGSLLRENGWVWFYFLYCGVSILWADDSYVSFKRWVKELGNPIMVLVILTEEEPYKAVGTILRRLAFLFLPLSVLFIKYFPDLGRSYWIDGTPMYTGVCHQKNHLGLICVMSALCLLWEALVRERSKFRLKVHGEYLVLILMIIWLLYMAQSATSTVCLFVGGSIILLSCVNVISRKPERIFIPILSAGFLYLVADSVFDVRSNVLSILGRRPDLTSRVPIWEILMDMAGNPILGVGFMSFWSGSRMEEVWHRTSSTIIQAHNGYLEQYLNLGYIGVGFIVVMMLSGLLKVRKGLSVDYPAGILRLSFIVIAALYNYTEASFYGINNMWMLLLLGIMEVPHKRGAEKMEPASGIV
jgi:exopolysaccharide production protein ExoQ